MTVSTAAICFIACHGGPADHFATFAQQLVQNKNSVQIYASGPALEKFKSRGVNVTNPFSLDKLSEAQEDVLAREIAATCSRASVVITDVGHVFAIKVQTALASYAVKRWAYYDNPEAFVPGGYSDTAAAVMLRAQGILFANSTLATMPIYQTEGKAIEFGERTRVGIGYYPVQQAELIAERRKTMHATARGELLSKSDLTGHIQKVIVYFGGNNDEYFNKAFPAFLEFMGKAAMHANLSDVLIVLQQHPGAKKENRDVNELKIWQAEYATNRQVPKVIISDFNSDQAQIVADAAFYYQTSMGPQFVLAGIPTVQVGHKTYADILVRSGLAPTVTQTAQLIEQLETKETQFLDRQVIFKGLGIKADWLDILQRTIGVVAAPQKVESRFRGEVISLLAFGSTVIIACIAAYFFKK